MDRFAQPFVQGAVASAIGPVPTLASSLSWADQAGSCRVRLGIGRMRYTVEPGLYAMGKPTSDSPVLVTANYKLSFDHLRKAVTAVDCWILVLETFGINVWCAAGKGTFGTAELVSRVKEVRLFELVHHRVLVVPQLGAPGIAAHRVFQESGFRVVYGPVLARDLPEFLKNEMLATPAMRRKMFPLSDRAVLIPVELVTAGKWVLPLFCLLFALGLLLENRVPATGLVNATQLPAAALLCGFLAGTVFTPLLLPLLPGRFFAVKGAFAGGVIFAFSLGLFWGWELVAVHKFVSIIGILVAVGVASILGMNFTGASTFTSLSGVQKEMRLAVPIQCLTLFLGLLGWGVWLWAL